MQLRRRSMMDTSKYGNFKYRYVYPLDTNSVSCVHADALTPTIRKDPVVVIMNILVNEFKIIWAN